MSDVPGSRPLAVQALRPGQVLAEDARDRSGRLLVPAGVRLTPKHLQVLRAWGVTEVRVVGEAAPEPIREQEATIPMALPQIEGLLAERFRHAPVRHPFMQALQEQSRRRLARTLKAGKRG